MSNKSKIALCKLCDNPKAERSKNLCEVHLQKAREHMRAYHAKRRAGIPIGKKGRRIGYEAKKIAVFKKVYWFIW